MKSLRVFCCLFACLCQAPVLAFDAEATAKSITITRDEFGVPHIHGPTDASVVFGYAYCQAEDYFWQVEENMLRACGRAAEAEGAVNLESDLLTHTFNIPGNCQARFKEMAEIDQTICTAFAEGLNYYLAKNPQTKPRLITKFEPWMVFATRMQVGLDWMFSKAHVSKKDHRDHVDASRVASNGWAIDKTRTKNGSTMLFINPHQPWFGPGSWYEGHIKSDEGWNFSGASFYGNPMPSLGHNEYLGWGHTANRPDVADAYRLTFDDTSEPLNYRSGDGYKTATKRREVIKIKTKDGMEERTYDFIDTHLGPVVKKEDDQHRIAVRISNLEKPAAFTQSYKMTKAKSWAEWRSALDELQLAMFNCIYADREGNIAYIYNGAVPRRDPAFAWDKPLDGSNVKTEWNGYHSIAELPQCVNPPGGYVQNCNQTPFMTTDDDNPPRENFPDYMVEDKDVETRRAQMSRKMLREMKDVTLDDWCHAGLDTKLYWPQTVFPAAKRDLAELQRTDPALAEKVKPYFDHLFNWDYQGGNDSTQATLTMAWYLELYAAGDPGADTKMQPKYMADPKARLAAIIPAANKLKLLYGDWKIPWGKVARIQRLTQVRGQEDLAAFSKDKPSVSCPGMPGNMGTIFNAYYLMPTPARREMFGIAGHSYVACIEFGKEKVEARSLLMFGESADPKSPHHMDQAELFSKSQFKPAHFTDEDVKKNAKRTYRPGEG